MPRQFSKAERVFAVREFFLSENEFLTKMDALRCIGERLRIPTFTLSKWVNLRLAKISAKEKAEKAEQAEKLRSEKLRAKEIAKNIKAEARKAQKAVKAAQKVIEKKAQNLTEKKAKKLKATDSEVKEGTEAMMRKWADIP